MYTELQFQHFIESTSDGLVFACARDRGKIRNFLINRRAALVLEQGRNGFVQIDADLARFVFANFQAGCAALYKTRHFALN